MPNKLACDGTGIVSPGDWTVRVFTIAACARGYGVPDTENSPPARAQRDHLASARESNKPTEKAQHRDGYGEH